MTINHISKVAVVGAGGNVGRFITEALLVTGKHVVTAITRIGSQSQLPTGVDVKRIDYNQPETLVDALRNQDVLVITLGGSALTLETQLINAAAEAGVPWILPNGWSPDTANEALVKFMKLASRVFFADGVGNFERKGTLNEVLNFSLESIDQATKVAIERSESSH